MLELEELLVIGALFCFAFCAIGVLTLRRSEPNLERGFRVPMVPLIPLLSLGATLWLMLNLKTSTWTKFGIWMAIGLAIYGLYGRWHSRLANEDSWDFDIGDTDPGTGGLQAIRPPDTERVARGAHTAARAAQAVARQAHAQLTPSRGCPRQRHVHDRCPRQHLGAELSTGEK